VAVNHGLLALLSQDLPAIWKAETTTAQEWKQLMRMVVESVQLDGIRQAGQIEIQIHWRSGTVTDHIVKRSAPGEGSLKTPEEAVLQIHEMARQNSYDEIAAHLNRTGLRTAFGRCYTSQHVGYICRRVDWPKASRAAHRKTLLIRLDFKRN